jgi:hypothetical protein
VSDNSDDGMAPQADVQVRGATALAGGTAFTTGSAAIRHARLTPGCWAALMAIRGEKYDQSYPDDADE